MSEHRNIRSVYPPCDCIIRADVPRFLSAKEKVRHARHILSIMTDQHNARCLGCAGDPVLRTPSIDRMAAEGVYLTNAYANSAHCGPSRVSFLTGMYEHTHRRHRNEEEPPMELASLPMRLREQGYQSATIGKGHVRGRRFNKTFGLPE